MKHKTAQQGTRRTWFGQVYSMALLIWLPLVLCNGYIYLITGKAWMFYGLTLCALAAFVVLVCHKGGLSAPGWRMAQGGRWWLLALVASFGISTILASDRHTALWGLMGRENGYIMLLACAGAFLFLRLTLTKQQLPALMAVLAGTGSIVAVLGWMNFFQMDPLDYYYVLAPEDRYQFLSTVGNTNFFGAYAAFAAAGAAAMCIQSEDRRIQWWFGGAAALLTSALFPAGSDGAWAAFVVAMLVLMCSKGLRQPAAVRLLAALEAGLLLGGCGLLLGHVVPVLGQPTGVSHLLGQPLVLLAAALVLGAMLFWMGRRPKEYSPVRLFRILALLLVVAFVVLTVLATVTQIPLGAVGEALKLGPTWGANRGYIWKTLVGNYVQYFSPAEKLLGVGPDGVDAVVNPQYTEYIAAYNAGVSVDSAHNIYLQVLLCGGIVGLICWCGFWAQRLWSAVRDHSVVLAPLVVYSVQAFFSIDMPALLPLAFALAAFSELPQGEKEQAPLPAVAAALLLGVVGIFLR